MKEVPIRNASSAPGGMEERGPAPRVRISVIVPTYERRDLVKLCVASLGRQDYPEPFEIIVVVDGSTDGTAAALAELELAIPLSVIEQPNRGAAAARSAGALAARGEILFFLDDDMEADPRLLREHDRAHRDGAQLVLGQIPLHPDSPPGLLSSLVDSWLRRRARRLAAPDAEIRVSDLIGGQLSVSREAFEGVGGFDSRLIRGQDLDFGYRVLAWGARPTFNPDAISWQRYVVTASQYLDQWRKAGRVSVIGARKHPELRARFLDRPMNRLRYRMVARVPVLAYCLRAIAMLLVDRRHRDPVTKRILFASQAVEFCRGLREAGGVPAPRRVRVLAYHAIMESAGSSPFEPYGVSPQNFRRHLELLERTGCTFIGVDELIQAMREGRGLPRRPVLLTFDDAYRSVLDHAVPLLQASGIPAVVFAVSGRLGGVNDWVRDPEAARVPLLGAEELRRLVTAGIEIGAHSRTHPRLPTLDDGSLSEEVGGSCRTLRALGVGPVRLFAYPYGEADARVANAVAEAECAAAFTVEAGFAGPGNHPFLLPRIEILRNDVGWRFLWKVATGRPAPFASAATPGSRSRRAGRSHWRVLARPVRRALRVAARP